MDRPSFIRRAVVAGTLALSLTGVTAGIDAAQAMPVAPVLAQGDAGAVTAVQYMMHRRHYRRNRHAGLYNCGRYALHTHLERRACGANPVGHNRYHR